MFFLFFMGLLFLQACGTLSQKDRETVPAETPTLTSSIEKALSSNSFEVGTWPKESWWEMFQDPGLDYLISIALKENPSIKKAEAKVRTASQMAKEKRASLFPELDASGESNWQYLGRNSFFRSVATTIPPVINQIDLDINFFYELDFFGKNRKLFQSAIGLAKAEEAEAKQATLLICIAIARAYFDLGLHLEKHQYLTSILEERKALEQLTSSRQEHGLDTEIEPIIKQIDAHAIELQLLQVDELIQLDLHQIKILIGHSPDDEEFIPTPFSIYHQAFPLPQNIGSDLLSRRPDLTAQIWRVEAAAKQIGAAKANFYPNVNLFAFLGLESLHFNTLFSKNSQMRDLHPAIHLPIFTGGKLQAHLEAKAAEFQEAVYSYNELLLNAAKEVVDQLTALQIIDDQIRVQTLITEGTSQKYALTENRFAEGIASYLDVLRIKDELLWQNLSDIELQYSRLIVILKLIKSLGGGYLSPYEITSHPKSR